MSTPETSADIVSAYSAATGAYSRWLNTPEWRRRKRVRLRATAERLAREADARRAAAGAKSDAMPLLELLDMQQADRDRDVDVAVGAPVYHEVPADSAVAQAADAQRIHVTGWGRMTIWLMRNPEGSVTFDRTGDGETWRVGFCDENGDTSYGTGPDPISAIEDGLGERT